jgi:hypothetical protein
LWLASKPADLTYNWSDRDDCACGRYGREHGIRNWECLPYLGGMSYGRNNMLIGRYDPLSLNNLAHDEPHTFGALYRRALLAWNQVTRQESAKESAHAGTA